MDSWFSQQFAHNLVWFSLLSLLSWLGPYATTGRHRAWVLTLWLASLAFGVACLAAAAVALLVGQPVHVVRPLGILGLVVTAVFAGLYRTLVRAYQEAELRRIAARDIG